MYIFLKELILKRCYKRERERKILLNEWRIAIYYLSFNVWIHKYTFLKMKTHLYFIIKMKNMCVRNVAIVLIQNVWCFYKCCIYVVSRQVTKRRSFLKLCRNFARLAKCSLICVCTYIERLLCMWSTTCYNITPTYVCPGTWNALHYTTVSKHVVIFGTRSLDRIRASFLITQRDFAYPRKNVICPFEWWNDDQIKYL